MIPQRAGINQVLKMFLCGPNAHQGGEGLPGKAAAHPGAGTVLGAQPPSGHHPPAPLPPPSFCLVLTSPESQTEFFISFRIYQIMFPCSMVTLSRKKNKHKTPQTKKTRTKNTKIKYCKISFFKNRSRNFISFKLKSQ